MSKERERFAKDALAAYEQGYLIIAARLNEVLAKRAPGLRIPAAPPEPGLTLADAARRLRNVLAGLRPFVPDMDDEGRICPWSLGYVNDITNPPERVGLRPDEDDIASTLAYLDKCRSDWPREMWQTRIVDRIQVYAADQRRWFVRQELAARLDSIEGVRRYIRELRARWPGPDDCHPLDPTGILEQLWAAMYLLGLSPPGLPPMAPSANLFAAGVRDDPEAHAVRAEAWRNFHDALNKAEQAAGSRYRPGSDNANDGSGKSPVDHVVPHAVKAKPERRGRRKADYETVQREARISDDWQRARESGTYKADFAKDKGLRVRDLDRLLDRVAKRNARSDK